MTITFTQGHAVLIGVGADLPNTLEDATGLANVLKDSGRCAYPANQVQLLTGAKATRSHILNALENLAATATPESTAIVYFSGHGYRVQTPIVEDYYLMPFGYNLNRLYETAISGDELAARLQAIPARRLLLLLDCCHAGDLDGSTTPGLSLSKAPLPPQTKALFIEGSGRVVIASSRADELSFAGKPYSAFTLALIESLAGASVAKKDGYVQVADLALHTQQMVPQRTNDRQHPILHFAQANNFVLAYYAGGESEPKALPFTQEPVIEDEPGALRQQSTYQAQLSGNGTTIHGQEATAVGERGVHVRGNVGGSINTGDQNVQGDWVGRDKITNQYFSQAFISERLAQYRQDLQTQYLTFWQQQVVATQFEADHLPLPVGQIFYADWLQTLLQRPAQPANDKKQTEKGKEQDEQVAQVKEPLIKGTQHSLNGIIDSLQAVFQLLPHLQNSRQTSQGVVLLGEPGAGKTLALRHFAAVQATQHTASDSPIPIYLSLNQYAGQNDLSEFIRDSLSVKQLPPSYSELASQLKFMLPNHRWLLLLDGFNEIGESAGDATRHRQAFLQALQTFVQQYRVEVVLSSRDNVIPDLDAFRLVYLRPLSQLGIEQCFHLYAPEHAADILRELEQQPALRHLVSNPFRAKAVAQIYKPDDSIPTTAVSLFARLVSHLVQRETQRCLLNGTQFPPIEKWQHTVMQIAARMNPTTAATLPSNSEEQEHLAFAAQCGLLLPPTTEVKFIHQQLQEYFAALWVESVIGKDGLHSEQLEPIWQDSNWDETVLLLCSLLPDQKLSELIVLIGEYDPYLAARAVGQTPERVSPAVRHWLAAYLGRAYGHLSHQEGGNIVRALGAMRCAEGFVQLTRQVDDNHRDDKVFLTAVAQYDTETSARFIGKQLYAAVQRDMEYRSIGATDYTLFTQALGQMKTPYARSFLVHALQDRKLTEAALAGIVNGRFHEAIPTLREALDSSEFEAICQAISAAHFTPLIADLLPYVKHSPAAMTALLRMNAGQTVIDYAAYFQQSLTRQYQFQEDLKWLGGVDDVWYRDTLAYYLFLEQYHSQETAAEFLDLLLAVAENSKDPRSYGKAIAVLLFVRHPQLPTLLDRLDIPQDEQDGYSSETAYYGLVKTAKMMLHLPVQPGFSAEPVTRFALQLSSWGNRPTPINMPTEPATLLQAIALDRQQVGEWALLFLQQQRTFTQYPRLVLDAMAALVELGWPDMTRRLITAATQCINAWKPGQEDRFDFRRISWQYVPLFVTYGQQNETQRQQILRQVAPQVHQVDGLWPLMAIEICTALQGVDFIDDWLRYLRDSTWRKAYPIVDALGRLDVPPAIVEKLVKKLASPLADERFFAVLALGEMRKTAVLRDLLALKREPDRQVQWALVWAIGHIGIITPPVADFLTTAATWNNGRARMEVAHAIGGNQWKSLTSPLYQLLNDPDLRVVERAVWAFGRLRDTAVTSALISLLAKTKNRYQRGSYEYHHRVEERLQRTLVIALTRIKQGVDIKIVTDDITKNLGAICSGLLEAKETNRIPSVETQPVVPIISAEEIAQQVAHIDTLSDQEKVHHIYDADLSQARLRSLELISAKESLPDDISNQYYFKRSEAEGDPARAVRILAHQQGKSAEIEFTPRHVVESLARGWIGVQEREDTYTTVRFDATEKWIDLQLAHWFADEFDLTELHDALLTQYSWQRLGKEMFSFMGDTLPESHLSQLILRWRHSIKYPELRYAGWQHGDTPPILNPLASRRKWSTVPDFVQMLSGTTNAALDAAYALVEMGIYQAATAIDKAMQTSTKRYSGEDMVERPLRTYMQAIVRVELLGATSNLVPLELLLENEQDDLRDGTFHDHLGDLLCEVDSHQPPPEWAAVRKLILDNENGTHDRFGAFKRGLQKWGAAALTQLFELEDWQFITRCLEDIQALIDKKEKAYVGNKFVQAAREMMQDRQTYPDTLFFSWLEHPQVPLRLWGLYTLAARHIPIPVETLQLLFTDTDSLLGYELLRCARAIPTLHAILQTMTQKSPSFVTSAEAVVAEQVTHLLTELIEEGDMIAKELLIHFRLPQFDPLILQMLDQEQFGTDAEFILFAWQLDAIKNSEILQEKLLALLQSENAVLVPLSMMRLLANGQRGFGSYLTPLLQVDAPMNSSSLLRGLRGSGTLTGKRTRL